MGHTKSDVEASVEVEVPEGEGFTCLYCETSYGSRCERDRCRASHFENTDSISQPKADRTRHLNKNIVEEWRED